MSRDFHKVLFARLLLPVLLVGGPVFGTDSELDAAITEIPDSVEVQAYRDIIDQMQTESGAYGASLPEHLLSLGQALQRQGRHAEAVTVFKRGVHLTRINDGLYSGEQIPLIRGEITSHIAMGQLTEADQRQHHLYRVQIRSLDSGDVRAQALMQQASWQLSAYRLDLGDQTYGRLMNMWDLYRLALTDIAERKGESSAELLPPLYGMLQAQYLISGYEAGSSSGPESDSDYTGRQEANRFNAYRAQSFSKGNAVLNAIFQIESFNDTEKKGAGSAEVQAQIGDWLLWHGQREGAEQAYREAHMELVERIDAKQQIERLFGQPRALPNLEGVRPLPPQAAETDANVLLEFAVTKRGRVVELERRDETEGIDGKVNRLMRRLRKTTFRPRIEAGEPVDTQRVVRAYVIGEH